MHRSRDGRSMATASTWLLRKGYCNTRKEAVKLVKRKKVKINNRIAETRIGYSLPRSIYIIDQGVI